jgi:hypothetical protein
LKKAKDSIPRVVKRLKENWPEAKTFGAISPYVPGVIAGMDRDDQRREREREEHAKDEQAQVEQRRQQAEDAKFVAAWKPVWDALPVAEQEEIRQAALTGYPVTSDPRKLFSDQEVRRILRRRSTPRCASPTRPI